MPALLARAFRCAGSALRPSCQSHCPAQTSAAGRCLSAGATGGAAGDNFSSLPRPQLDIRELVQNTSAVAMNAADRACGETAIESIPRVAELHAEITSLRLQVEVMRSERKQLGRQGESGAGGCPRSIQRGKQLRKDLVKLAAKLESKDSEMIALASRLPNTTHSAVPRGGEEANRIMYSSELRGGAGLPAFDFTPRDHFEIGAGLGLFDFAAASAAAGSKFVYLTGAGALLELALVNFAMHTMAERGYSPVITPDVVKHSVVEACGYLPRRQSGQLESYALEGTGLVLAATAEAPLAAMWAGKRLTHDDLPAKQVGFSHCFRTEVGSRGSEVRGLYRMHQFSKVELFMVSSPTQSSGLLEELREAAEDILQMLGLHYRVVEMASGELGNSAHRKYDVEAWMPGRQGGKLTGQIGQFGEVASISNCTDYQARRLHIRIRNQHGKGSEFAHTLNGTALAVPRVMIALLETYQQRDGSVVVPEVLRGYLGGRDKLLPDVAT